MSSRKVPEMILEMEVDKNGVYRWINPSDLQKYCNEHPSEKLFVHIEPVSQVSEKMKMFRYWYWVILPCAVIGFTVNGYDAVDNVTADYLLRCELAKDYVRKGEEWIPIVLDKRNMTKARLHKLLSDAIFFIEETLQQGIPDSQEYKLFKETGKKFKPIK